MSGIWPAPLLEWVRAHPSLRGPLRGSLAAAWEAGHRAALDDDEAGHNPWAERCLWPASPRCAQPRAVGQLCIEHADLASNLLDSSD